MGMALPSQQEKSHTLFCVDCGQSFTWPNRKKKRCAECDKKASQARRERWLESQGGVNAYLARYRDKNREKLRAYGREWRRRNYVQKPRDPDLAVLKEKQRQHPHLSGYLKKKRDHLKHLYGFGLGGYDILLARQGGGCAVCRRPPQRIYGLHVDHDHDTGEVRGLLCGLCNMMIGHAHDDPAVLRSAADYLDSVGAVALAAGPPPRTKEAQ